MFINIYTSYTYCKSPDFLLFVNLTILVGLILSEMVDIADICMAPQMTIKSKSTELILQSEGQVIETS